LQTILADAGCLWSV